ncbi:unnamed protein product [Pedinophyceae sp. YPF-701]|nr:unnamed protein product [Pedinophyceae sp. YPF-701]
MSPAVIRCWERAPALGAIAGARMAGVDVKVESDAKYPKTNPPVMVLPDGFEISGVPMMLRFIARTAAARADAPALYGAPGDARTAVEVEQWLDVCATLVAGPTFQPVCHALSDCLAARTYLVGHALTLADLAIWSQLATTPMWDKVKSSPGAVHLARWFSFIGDHAECARAAAEFKSAGKSSETAKRAAEVTGKKKGEGGTFDLDLPGAAPGKVVTRFPPEPSGYLHVGHAKAALLNHYFAKIYDGRLIVRFDDTNPTKEKDEFVESILRDIKTLGIEWDRITYTSDYFDRLQEAARRLIGAGVMYGDTTPVDVMREERLACKESRCRGQSVEENLRLWREMLAGSAEGQSCCMRLKIDMKSENGCMRDPVAYRCNLVPHHRTGTRYKAYPTYDFACPFVDAFEGVTHALRTSEYKDREPQYYWILKAHQSVCPGLPDVCMWDFARLNFQYTVLSKRKLQYFCDQGYVQSWFDARFPTVQGLVRRGLQVEALRGAISAPSSRAVAAVHGQAATRRWSWGRRSEPPDGVLRGALRGPRRDPRRCRGRGASRRGRAGGGAAASRFDGLVRGRHRRAQWTSR